MDAIREIKKVKNGKVEILLPKNLDGKDVEVIILMDTIARKKTQTDKKNGGRSLAGILHKYANPAMIPQEKETWPNAVKDKHGLH